MSAHEIGGGYAVKRLGRNGGYQVSVDADTFTFRAGGSAVRLPFAFALGVIGDDGVVEAWEPAGGVRPRHRQAYLLAADRQLKKLARLMRHERPKVRAHVQRRNLPNPSHHEEPHLPERGGYAYLFRGRNWKTARDERWDTVMYTPTGRERAWGWRRIDGAVCVVFRAGPTKFVAVTAVSVGMGAFANRMGR